MIDISIIITSYNVAGYIGRAVESALSQQGVSLEVIMVDDASADGTWEVITALQDPRIKRFRLEQNGGPSVARNHGIAQASGEWIAVLDGDDVLLAGRLERMLRRVREARADAVVDNLLVHREANGSKFLMFHPAQFDKLDRLELATFICERLRWNDRYTLGYVKPVVSAAFLRQHQLEYDPNLRIGEDYRLLAEALALGAVCVVEPTSGYCYTVRAGSISHRLSVETMSQMRASEAAFMTRYKLTGKAARAQRWRMLRQREMQAYVLLVAAIKRRSVSGVAQAIACCPTSVRLLWEPLWVRISHAR